MLHVSRPNYICLRCLSSSPQGVLSRQAAGGGRILARAIETSPLRAATGRRTNATVRDASEASQARPETLATRRAASIRERLIQWEKDNPGLDQSQLPTAVDTPIPGSTANARMGGTDTIQFDEEVQEQTILQGDGLMDLRSDASRLEAGDLIEISSESWHLGLLAVCLGNFNGLDHFYTHTGKWVTSSSIRTRFVVKKFVTESHELRPVLNELPPSDTPLENIKLLQELRLGPSRSAGAVLINKMLQFQTEARLSHRTHMNKLDDAFKTLGTGETLLTLNEIAEKLLPAGSKRKGQFSPQALYAVHMALCQDDVAFQPLASRGAGQSYYFRVISAADHKLAKHVEELVRDFYEDPKRLEGPLRQRSLEKTKLGSFVLKARKVIDTSRKARDWSTHGVLSPWNGKTVPPVFPEWTPQDMKILTFIDRWAKDQMFSRGSRLHWAGSAILRALDRYQEAEYLTSSIGWVFLQEIGWVMPWEITARHTLRLPGVQLSRAGGIAPFKEDSSRLMLNADCFEQSPTYPGRTRTTTKVYCVDSESTLDVDDGISLERTETPGEYWIHVHVADPASRLSHDSWQATRASLVPQTTYLPGHYHSMFQDPAIRETFSLATDRPSLTFSAKVNEEGTLLDHKIVPSTLSDVVYMTPEEVLFAAGDISEAIPVPGDTFEVGRAPNSPPRPSKKMTKAGDLTAADVEDLQILSRIAKTLQDRRNAKGAIPVYAASPQVEISMEDVNVASVPGGFLHCTGDPYIRLSYSDASGSPLVSSTMQLAGEVAARWCASRGIPIPYRVQDPGCRHRSTVDAFTQNVFYPQLLAGQRPPQEQWRQLHQLIGTQKISAEPAPLYTMGVDMYTKATSPLRRYSDLLVHWQIEAALLEEARRGESLVGNTSDEFLPFKRAELDLHVLPQLQMRERHARLLDKLDGTAEWMLQALVRAWKFGGASGGTPLPETFRFTVSEVVGRRLVLGQINWFERRANLGVEGMKGIALISEVRAGDVFEVELQDVNVYQKNISLKALRKIT